MAPCTSSPSLTKQTTLPKEKVGEIRNAIVSLLRRCDLRFPPVEYDYDFDAACRAEAIRRGYPMEGPRSLASFIPGGVAMAASTYPHITDKSTRFFISLYTASLIYIDDIFQYDVEPLLDFNSRFILQMPQKIDVLDCFANLLLDLPKLFSPVVSNIITATTLNFVTALILEYETGNMTLGPDAGKYASYLRILSGAPEAYAFFIFPPEVPVSTYIQALPDLVTFLNNGNDVLSFYKEELAGESVNQVSLLARLHGVKKQEALLLLVNCIVEAHSRTLRLLQPHKAALDAFLTFATGYLGFHALLPRYKLEELELTSPAGIQG